MPLQCFHASTQLIYTSRQVGTLVFSSIKNNSTNVGGGLVTLFPVGGAADAVAPPPAAVGVKSSERLIELMVQLQHIHDKLLDTEFQRAIPLRFDIFNWVTRQDVAQKMEGN